MQASAAFGVGMRLEKGHDLRWNEDMLIEGMKHWHNGRFHHTCVSISKVLDMFEAFTI